MRNHRVHRQFLWGTLLFGPCLLLFEQLPVVQIPLLDQLSVSYTHLDVYKRQSLEYCTMSVDETLRKLETDPKSGLGSIAEASRRKLVYGANEIVIEEDESLWKKFLSSFVEDRLILLLIGSAVVSFIMGNIDDAVSITLAIVIVVSVGFVQEYRSEKSLEALNKLVPAECHLIRCGQESHVLASGLVPGDLVHFKIGDRIPADLRIIEAVDLSIDESNLTGENEPVHKSAKEVNKDSFNDQPNSIIPISDRTCVAYMGTLVKEGHGKGIVVGIGKKDVYKRQTQRRI